MTFIETNVKTEDQLTTRQRWSHYFAILFGILAIIIALNIRAGTLNATNIYINNEFGITAAYPQEWLIDESGTDYIFRVRNMQEIGFSTTFQASVVPIGPDTTERTVIDVLAIQRAQTLAAYRTLSISPYPLPNDRVGTAAIYTYVATDANPFLQSVPIVVQGIDIINITRGQAIVITMLSDAQRFEEHTPRFERFVNDLEF